MTTDKIIINGFKTRLTVQSSYYEWLDEVKAADTPFTVISYLQCMGLLKDCNKFARQWEEDHGTD